MEEAEIVPFLTVLQTVRLLQGCGVQMKQEESWKLQHANSLHHKKKWKDVEEEQAADI